MSTTDNLMGAFAGESQANRKYLAFAAQAEKDGYPEIAKLFRAAADAETIHALSHFKVAGGVKSTAENVQAAISGENYEHTAMYPEFIAEAEKEGNAAAVRTFTLANEVEKVHEALYKIAAEALASGKDIEPNKLYICPVCGYLEYGSAPETCPVCGAKGSVFKESL